MAMNVYHSLLLPPTVLNHPHHQLQHLHVEEMVTVVWILLELLLILAVALGSVALLLLRVQSLPVYKYQQQLLLQLQQQLHVSVLEHPVQPPLTLAAILDKLVHLFLEVQSTVYPDKTRF